MAFESEKRVAIAAVREAMQLCEAVRSERVSEDSFAKHDRSPVTVADFGSQAMVLHALADAFPQDKVVAEEESAALRSPDGAALCERVVAYVQRQRAEMSREQVLAAIDRGDHGGGPSGRFWVLDPIDGTKGFLRKEQYAVALGLVENGRVVMGVLGCPQLPNDRVGGDGERGGLCVAVRGEGASLLGEHAAPTPIRVSTNGDSRKAAFCESVEAGHSAHDVSKAIADSLGITRESVRLDSQCKYAVVARGEAEIYMRLPTRADYQECIWDHAAGCMVVEEAGGCVTDIYGQPLDFSQGRTLVQNKGVIATNGLLHEAVIAAIKATGCG